MFQKKDFQLNLTANIPQTIHLQGDMYSILEASNNVYLMFGDSNEYIKRSAGIAENINYTKITVMSIVSQNILLTLGFGILFDARALTQATIDTKIELANTFETSADITITQSTPTKILSGDDNIKSVVISSLQANLSEIRLGDVHVDVDRGIPIQGGDTVIFDCSADVWAYTDGLAQKVAVNITRFV